MTANESPNERSPSIAGQASEWFVELREGDLDDAGHARFSAWLRKSPEHIHAYMEIAALWGDIPRLSAGMEVDVEAVVAYARAHRNVVSLGKGEPSRAHEFPVAGHQSRRSAAELSWVRRPVGLAACVAAIAGCVGVLTWWLLGRAPIYSTAIGEQRTVVLDDGSSMELSARSRVRVQLTDTQRGVELLSGQALFRVAKDESRPFVVTSNNTMVRAVGTQFDVHRRSSGTTVTVIEGRVAVMSEPRSSAVPEEHPVIAANTYAVYVSAGEQITVPASAAAAADDLLADVSALRPHPIDTSMTAARGERTLNFQDAPLADVIEEFNRYNQAQIVITQPALEKLRISGVFSANKPASLLRFLEDQAQLDVMITEEQVRVSPK